MNSSVSADGLLKYSARRWTGPVLSSSDGMWLVGVTLIARLNVTSSGIDVPTRASVASSHIGALMSVMYGVGDSTSSSVARVAVLAPPEPVLPRSSILACILSGPAYPVAGL